MSSFEITRLSLLAAAALFLVTGSAAFAGTLDPGDPDDPTDCGTRYVVDNVYLSHFTGDLDLCVDGNITISAPNGVVADFLRVDAPVDFSFVEECCLSNQFLPPPETPLVAAMVGDAFFDWGAARGNVRLVATGDVAFVVPEPGTAGLLLGGLLAFASAGRRSFRSDRRR